MYQRDFLNIISEAYEGFNRFLKTHRNNNESSKSFQIRFSAAVAKFNSMFTTTKLPQCTTALMLLSSAAIEHLQRVSCLNAAALTGTVFTDQSSNDACLKTVTCEQLASVVKKCEKASTVSSFANAALAATFAGAFSKGSNRGCGC